MSLVPDPSEEIYAAIEEQRMRRENNEYYETEKKSVLDEIDAFTQSLIAAAENQTEKAADKSDDRVELRHSVFVNALRDFRSRMNTLLEFNKNAGAEARADVLKFIQTKGNEVKQGVKDYISTKEREKLRRRSEFEQKFTDFCEKLLGFVKLVEHGDQQAAYSVFEEINYRFGLNTPLGAQFSVRQLRAIYEVIGVKISYNLEPEFKEFVNQDLTEFKKIIEGAKARWLETTGLNILRQSTPDYVEPNTAKTEAASPAP